MLGVGDLRMGILAWEALERICRWGSLESNKNAMLIDIAKRSNFM